MRPIRGLLIATVLCGVAVVATACGASPDATVANLGSSHSQPASSSGSDPSSGHSMLAFAQCMRSHGISDFPDPNGQGQISISGGSGSDLNPNNPQFQAAQHQCRSRLPASAAPSPSQIAQAKQNALNFSKCMRSHGVPNFPDPQFSNNGGRISIRATGNGLDPNSPQFQSAQRACSKYMHGTGKGGIRFHTGSVPPGPGSNSKSGEVVG